jgi:hypothetical protein
MMEKLSGLVLDRYDLDGEGRRSLCGSIPGYEDLDKCAHVFTPDELQRLPDETFALIIEDSGTVLKKFSMADAGNTGLSVIHFLENGHKLPEEAQKVAAANLIRGCGWYHIPISDELQKIAFGAMGLINAALVAPGAMREAKNNLAAVKGAGPGIMTPDQIKARRLQMGV